MLVSCIYLMSVPARAADAAADVEHLGGHVGLGELEHLLGEVVLGLDEVLAAVEGALALALGVPALGLG